MIELTVQQGSVEWMAARAKCFNASEAAAMMGVSPYLTRQELLRQKKTGIVPEVDSGTQRRFDAGHEAEAAARVIVEEIIGEELFPVVATDDDGRLLASSDGATMLYDIGFEAKLWNESTVAEVEAGNVPDHHKWQLDQQIAIFGFEKIIFVCSDGTRERFVSCEYRTTPERIARLKAGWDQFEKDLADFEPPTESEPAAVGRAPDALPALRIEVTGMVTASNLDAFRKHALAVIGAIKTDLQTDADFADAEKTVKWAKEVEDKLDAAKDHALSQTESIDALFRTIDDVKEQARAVRLKLDKLVKSEKENRRTQIVTDAQKALAAHIDALNRRLAGDFMPTPNFQMFGEAIKGLKSLDSMRDKVSSALANAKVDTNAIADRIEANRKSVEDMTLFPDFAQVCTKPAEDFAALLAMRANARREAEAKRLEDEREKIRAEEQAKAQREANEAAKREAEAKAQQELASAKESSDGADLSPEAQSLNEKEGAARFHGSHRTPPKEPAADNGKTITLGQINALLAPVSVTRAGIASLGIEPAGQERSAVLYRESDVSRICTALIEHLSRVQSSPGIRAVREAA